MKTPDQPISKKNNQYIEKIRRVSKLGNITFKKKLDFDPHYVMTTPIKKSIHQKTISPSG